MRGLHLRGYVEGFVVFLRDNPDNRPIGQRSALKEALPPTTLPVVATFIFESYTASEDACLVPPNAPLKGRGAFCRVPLEAFLGQTGSRGMPSIIALLLPLISRAGIARLRWFVSHGLGGILGTGFIRAVIAEKQNLGRGRDKPSYRCEKT